MHTKKDLANELGVQVYDINNLLTNTKLTVVGSKQSNRIYFDEANADIIRGAIKKLKGERIVFGGTAQ